jgi:hypothetical protein
VRRRFFDPNHEPAFNNSEHIAGWERTFDERGNVVEHRYLGEQGELVLGTSGIAGWRARYDERGRRIEETYFGADQEPVGLKGAVRRVLSYDGFGRHVKTTGYAADGSSVP